MKTLPERLVNACLDLMDEGRKAVRLNEGGKAAEPRLTLAFESDGSVYASFYSYCLDLEDGGRHHVIQAETLEQLVLGLERMAWVAEEENHFTAEVILADVYGDDAQAEGGE